MIIKIIENITGFVKNLNLSKKDVAGIIVVALLIATSMSANHHRSKANKLAVSLELVNSELRIDGDNNKVSDGEEKIEVLEKKIADQDAELLGLYGELDDLRKVSPTRTDIMEELGDISNTKDVCHAFADLGYPICDKL